ncbi:unnamed protein product [Lupinus luteus]|uniref:Nudix hydrolase domain-containing protein n=1 Tax=Lupinus luteus TaxID=3873 RepID=A0AAV1XPI3_LUPLU
MDNDEIEVLVISSQNQKGKGILFPKGGWELDEYKKEAALRETMEEAGVRGIVGELQLVRGQLAAEQSRCFKFEAEEPLCYSFQCIHSSSITGLEGLSLHEAKMGVSHSFKDVSDNNNGGSFIARRRLDITSRIIGASKTIRLSCC